MKMPEFAERAIVFFFWHPERIALISAVLFVGFASMLAMRRFRAWPVLIPAALWGLFALWEWFVKVMRYDIRVDLLVIYPVLIVATVWGTLAALRPRRRVKQT